MLPEECRKLAALYHNQAGQAGASLRAAALRKIADSFVGLASQFETLTALERNESRQTRTPSA